MALVPRLDEVRERLALLAERGLITPTDLADADEVFADIRMAARVHASSSAGRTAEPRVAELARRSKGEISSDEAAEILGVSATYVRRLLRLGVLAGRKVHREWLVDNASLRTYLDVRRAA